MRHLSNPTMTKHRTVAVIVLSTALAIVFLAPVVPLATPDGVTMCPNNGCWWPAYGSISYWASGLGGVVLVNHMNGAYLYKIAS